MARNIPQRELRNHYATVIGAVAAGESFVITRHGEPVAELTPIQNRRRTFISRAEIEELAATGVRIDYRRFREDLDTAFDGRA